MQKSLQLNGSRLVLVLILFVCSLVIAFAGNVTPIVPNGQKTASTDYVVPTLDGLSNGYLAVATPTLSVGTATAVIIGTLPTGAKIVDIYIFDNDINIGGSGVSTGSKVGFIASGASHLGISVATTTPAIYFRGRTGTGTVYFNAR